MYFRQNLLCYSVHITSTYKKIYSLLNESVHVCDLLLILFSIESGLKCHYACEAMKDRTHCWVLLVWVACC